MTLNNPEEVEKYIAVLLSCKDFTGEDLANAKLQGLDFRGCVMEGVNLEDADLSNANMEGCDLYWGFLCGTNFANANLAHAKLNGANIKGANFSHANLCGADFGSDAFGCATKLSETNFTNATYDDSTVLPLDFDPVSNGMIRITERNVTGT